MAKHYNAAARVKKVFERAERFGKPDMGAQKGFGGTPAANAQSINALDAWAQILDVSGGDAHSRYFQTVELLQALHSETQLVLRGMQETDSDPEIWQEPVLQALSCLNPETISSTNWGDQSKQLELGTVRGLLMCSELLPEDQETPVSPEDLEAISAQINEFQAYVDHSDLPFNVKLYFQKQIEFLRQALRKYSIVGERAFQDAFQEAIAVRERDLPTTDDETSETTQAVSKLHAIWAKVNTSTGFFDKLLRWVELGVKLLGIAHPDLPKIGPH